MIINGKLFTRYAVTWQYDTKGAAEYTTFVMASSAKAAEDFIRLSRKEKLFVWSVKECAK